jgi:hypothetical protein
VRLAASEHSGLNYMRHDKSAGLAVRGLRRSTRGGRQVFERRIKPSLASEAHRFTAAKNTYNDDVRVCYSRKWTAVRYRGRLEHEEARFSKRRPEREEAVEAEDQRRRRNKVARSMPV